MKVGLLGCGTVGSGVYEICQDSKLNLDILKVLVLDVKENDPACFTTTANDVLNNPDIECICEAMGGLHPAREYILQALNNGKHVVSANKAVIAAYMNEFMEAAHRNHVSFCFEASVGGGIPWLKNLMRVKRIDEIHKIRGIINGTSNYILDELFTKGADFDEVLKEAQRLGYAEADPTADIEGYDVLNKCAISASLAFNGFVDIQDIDVAGMSRIQANDVCYMKKHGWVCKLLANAEYMNDSITAYVQPCCVDDRNLFAHIPANFNLVSCTSKTLGESMYYGQGAGKYPTAHAMVQDMIDIMKDEQDVYDLNQSLIVDNSKASMRYYMRCSLDSVYLDEFKSMCIQYECDDVYFYGISEMMTVQDMHNKIKVYYENEKNCFIAGILRG